MRPPAPCLLAPTPAARGPELRGPSCSLGRAARHTRGSSVGWATRSPSETTSAHGGPCKPPGCQYPRRHMCPVAQHRRSWQTPGEGSQAAERRQRRWEPGPSDQKGGGISGGREGRERTKESRRRGQEEVCTARSVGRPLRRQRARGRGRPEDSSILSLPLSAPARPLPDTCEAAQKCAPA